MTIQTYKIELKLDTPSDEAHEALCQIIKQYARDLQATSMLLSGRSQPQVIAQATDSFYTTQEIELLEPSEHVGAIE
jgi:hypothetical protein